MRVLFVTKSRSNTYGISIGLKNSARLVADALNKLYFPKIICKDVSVIDGNGIDKEIHDFKPDHVIIEAIWATPKKIFELACKYPKIIFNIRIHSKMPFLAMEGPATEYINGYVAYAKGMKNIRVSSNNQSLIDDFAMVLNYEFDLLPNIYLLEKRKKIKKTKHKDTFINIGCFGAIRPLKNTLKQAVAAIHFAEKHKKILRFHINGNRIEQHADPILKNLRSLFAHTKHHRLIEHPWMPHDEFLKVMKKMDLHLQVSLSESFNIVTSDAILENIPIVVSHEIDWAHSSFRADPNDLKDILNKMDKAWKWRNHTYLNYNSLYNYSIDAVNKWINYFRKFS